jgi:RHS repeat-associated protein
MTNINQLPTKPTSPTSKSTGFLPTKKQIPVSPATAKVAIENRVISSTVYKPPKNDKKPKAAMAGFGSNTVSLTSNITELARALKHDVDLIFECVHNNIEWLPTFGTQKGATGALIDGFGNSFDQADLMISLLRESGYTADFQIGELELSEVDAAAWLGTDVNIFAASNLLADGGIPNEAFWTGTNWVLRLTHVWVKVNIGGIDYVFDPARKSYVSTLGIDLDTAMGYSESTFLSQARSGATIAADYVQNIHRANLRSELDDYTLNLVSWLKSNKPNASIDDVLGGRTIVPISGAVRLTSLPYLRPGTTPTAWSAIPNSYKATLRVLYDTIDQTFFSADVHGKRLTLFFNASHQAELRLDGSLIATSSAQGVGTWNSVFLESTHPYPTTFADEGHWQMVWADKYYVIAQAWGNAGRKMTELHREKLAANRQAGGASMDEAVFGEYLSATWHMWNNQKSIAADFIGRITNCTTVLHHQTGLVGHFDTVFTDLGGIVWSSSALDNNWNNVDTNNTSLAMHGIAMEASVIQEMASVGGASTTPLLDIANSSGQKIYDAKSSNWLTAVQPNLVNYSSGTMTDIENWWITPGWRVALPEDGLINKGSWNGFAYYAISPGWGAIGIITGGLKGGSGVFVVVPEDEEKAELLKGTVVIDDRKTMTDDVTESEEPVGLTAGYYTSRQSDLSVGGGSFPYFIEFSRSYNSNKRYTDGPLGYGWDHNFNGSVSIATKALLAMGDVNAVASAVSLVEYYVGTKLFTDLTKPLDKWIVAASCNQWLVDQFYQNTISVNGPGFSIRFLRQPNGSFLPSAGEDVSLIKNLDGTYSYSAQDKTTANFNSSGQISNIVSSFGITTTFTYSGGKVTNVSNGLGRSLTLTYSGARLASVSDGTRSVLYSVNGVGNLVSVTNPRSKTTVYEYDLPGRLTKIFMPANPSSPIITNTYDALGRVKEQRDAYNNLWQYHLAGHRTEEVNPAGTSRVLYFDKFGNPVSEAACIACTPQATENEYDVLGRLIKQTMPEGNGFVYSYNNKNQLLENRQFAKPGSGLADLVTTYTYESVFGKVATVTDPSGETVSHTYDPTTGQKIRVDYPVVGGVTPQVSFTYNSRGQLLTVTDQLGVVTKFTYDPVTADHLSTIVDFGLGRLNLTVSYAYNSVGDLVSLTNFNGTASIDYDPCRLVTQSTSTSPFCITKFTYDDNNKLVKTERETGDPLEPWETLESVYDIDGLVAQRINQAGKVSLFSYNNLRKLSSVENSLHETNSMLYAPSGRLLSLTDAAGATVDTRTYTDNGRIASLKDVNNNLTQLTYDGFDRRIKTIFADGTYEEVLAYTNNGRPLTLRRRSGQTIAYTYYDLGLVKTKTVQGQPTITYGYDLANRVQTISTPVVLGDPSTGVFELVYDAAGRILQEKYPDGKTLVFEYDESGNQTKLVYPDGYFVERVYDAMGRLTDIKLNGSVASAVHYEYNKLSQRVKTTYGNGVVTHYRYSKAGDCISLEHNFLSESVDFQNRFDDVRQLKSVGVSNAEYVWSPAALGSTTYSAANNLNEYPSVGGASFAYNSQGCLTSDGVWTFGYDTLNNLTSASNGSTNLSFLYDPRGRQIQKTVGAAKTGYLYANAQRVAEYNNNSGALNQRLIYGATLDEVVLTVSSAGVVNYISHNTIGSAVAVTDSTGAVTTRCSYSPWGESSALGTMPIGFTGQRPDTETGLYYYKNRYYSPKLGRFLQPDPAGYQSSYNAYQYAKENPLLFIDPLGLEEQFEGSISSVSLMGAFLLLVSGLRVKKRGDDGSECITNGKVNEMYNSTEWGQSQYDKHLMTDFGAFTQFFANEVGCPPPGASDTEKGQWGEALTVAWYQYMQVLAYPTMQTERLRVTFSDDRSALTRPDVWYADPRGEFNHGSWAETKVHEGRLPTIAQLSFTPMQKVAYPALATGLGDREYGTITPFVPGGDFQPIYEIGIPLPIQLYRISYMWV